MILWLNPSIVWFLNLESPVFHPTLIAFGPLPWILGSNLKNPVKWRATQDVEFPPNTSNQGSANLLQAATHLTSTEWEMIRQSLDLRTFRGTKTWDSMILMDCFANSLWGRWDPSKTRTFPLQAWVIFYFHDYGRTGTISHKEDPTCDILWQSFCCNRTTHLWEQLSDPSNLLVHPVWSFCVLLERLPSLSFWKSRMTLKHLETLCDMVFLDYNCLNSYWDKPPFSSYPTFFVHCLCVCK